MVKCCKEAEAFISLEKRLLDLHLPPWEWPAGSEPLGPRQKFVSGLDLVPDCLEALLLCCRGCANTMRLHGLGGKGIKKTKQKQKKTKTVTYSLLTTFAFNSFCHLHFTESKCIFRLDILPSLWILVHLDSAKAGSLRLSSPALSGLPVPSPRPAGPGTGKGSSHLLPALQRADRPLLGQSSASWRHIFRTQSRIIGVFFCPHYFPHYTVALVSHSQSILRK